MTEEAGNTGDRGPEVGSVGEEAAKLFGALADWAREQPGSDRASGGVAADGLLEGLRHVNDHIAGEDCRYCPVCRVIHAVRETSPEVKEHLATAASSLVQAAAGLLETRVQPRPREPVERIDLDDDDPTADH